MSYTNNNLDTRTTQSMYELVEDIVWPTTWVVDVRIKNLTITICIRADDGLFTFVCCLVHTGLCEGFLIENLYTLYNFFFAGYQLISDSSLLASILPIYKYGMSKIYDNPIDSRSLIREENNGKVGVYCWVNNVNGKYYVGSGDPLYLRLSDYYQHWYFAARPALYIVRAFGKYGMINFSLII